MTADPFTQERFAWLDQVLSDARVFPSTFAVAYVIGRHLNRQSGQAWPSHSTIARSANVSEPTVKRSLNLLVRLDHLEKITRKGVPCLYRPVLKPRSPMTYVDGQTQVTHDLGGKSNLGHPRPPLRSPMTPDLGHPRPTNSLKNHFRNPLNIARERATPNKKGRAPALVGQSPPSEPATSATEVLKPVASTSVPRLKRIWPKESERVYIPPKATDDDIKECRRQTVILALGLMGDQVTTADDEWSRLPVVVRKSLIDGSVASGAMLVAEYADTLLQFGCKQRTRD